MKKRLLKFSLWFIGIILGIFLLISGGLYYFKDEICGYVIGEANQHLKAKVSVSNVDLTFWGTFPKLSVDFNEVFIQDSYEKSTNRDTLLFTERIRLKFNASDVWNEKYNVQEIEIFPGTIQLKINKDGQNNYDILKETKDTTAAKFNVSLEKVNFENVRFSYKNKSTGQYYSNYLNQLDLEGKFSEKEYAMHCKSDLFVNQAKSGDVTLVSNKHANFDLKINVNQETDVVEIPKAILYVANLPFEINGKVTPEDLKFRIHSKNLQLEDVANNLSHSSLSNIKKFEGSGAVDFDLYLEGKMDSDESPEINCKFGINSGNLTEPSKGLKLKNIFLKGRYSNQGGKEKEFLNLSDISFSTIGGPFSGNLLLTNFDSPIYAGNAKGILDLAVGQSIIAFPGIQDVKGRVDLNNEFNIQAITNEDESVQYDIRKCDGDVHLENVSLQMKDDKRLFSDINGFVYLRDSELGIEDITLKVGSSDLKVNGVFQDIIGFFRDENKLMADVDVSSNFMDIQDLSTETKEEQISDGRDWIMPTNVDGNVSFEAGEIKYEKHRFKKFKGDLAVGKRVLQFSDVTVQNANADIRGGLTIEERTPEVFTISTQLASDNIEFKALFHEWNNFEQEVISEDNIYGKAHVLLDFSAPFDLKNGVIKNAIKSQIQLKIIGGRLKNVSTFKTITESLKSSKAKLIIKKNNINDFEKKLLDLKFETLENTLIIRNGQLEIPKMMIHSSAMDIELYGKHDFDDNIDYHFSFRFREIQTQKSQDEFGTIIDDGTSMKIFVRMHGNLDNPIIEWDQDARKEQAKENREAAKQDAKSIFKSEFGLFKNDTTVKMYQPIKQQKEELKMEFGPDKKEDPLEEEKKKIKKETKIGKTLKDWKKEAEKEKKEVFEDDF
jgi:hypothetical protein